MESDRTIYDRVKGLKPIDETLLSQLEEKIDDTLPKIIEAVEQREILAELSRYREIEILRELQKNFN